MANDDLKLIQNKIIEKGQSWTAGTTPLSGLSQEEKKKYLGLVIPEDEMKKVREMASREEAFIARQGRAFVYATSWDWRSVNGTNWTTPIRNQSGCGACVAFRHRCHRRGQLKAIPENSCHRSQPFRGGPLLPGLRGLLPERLELCACLELRPKQRHSR